MIIKLREISFSRICAYQCAPLPNQGNGFTLGFMIELIDISKNYGERKILERVSWKITEGKKIGLLGDNGVGKTTLLKIIAGLLEPDEGEVKKRPHLEIGYLPQEIEEEELDLTLFDFVRNVREEVVSIEKRLKELERMLEITPSGSEGLDKLVEEYSALEVKFRVLGGYGLNSRVEKVLGGLGFRRENWFRPLSSLSGGFRIRAHLAKLLALDPDLYLLDEPTNNLDLPSLGWLEDYLKGLDKTMIIVTHDRYFLDKVVKEVVELEFGKLSFYPFSYTAYVSEKRRRIE